MTKNFKTRSEIIERRMPKIKGNNQHAGKTIIALDGGYSSIKGVSGNKTFCFPSYAKKMKDDLSIVGKLKDSDILLRDNKTGVLWAIGSFAETQMERSDLAQTTDESLFTRYRYKSDVFKALMSAGIAIGLLDTAPGQDIHIQTGLPSKYLKEDKPELVNALAGEYDLSIKLGNADYRSFKFSIAPENVDVMQQPQGTLLACAYDKNGNMLPNGAEIISSNSIIYDIGFGTEDIFVIRGGANIDHNTDTDTGMKAVFEATIEEIGKRYPAAVYKVFEFQKFLESGQAIYYDRNTRSSNTIEFEDILREKNRLLCEKSIDRLMEKYDNLLDYKYLVVTGGTGESRYEQICEMLKGLSHLTILRGNENDDSLPFCFSNVRGYYMCKYLKLMKEMQLTQ